MQAPVYILFYLKQINACTYFHLRGVNVQVTYPGNALGCWVAFTVKM